jgi:hypothetical protein
MNRRGFLKAFGIAAPAIILTPGLLMPVRKILSAELTFVQSGTGATAATVQAMLKLWGDGIHDDTAALQALVDGREVMFNGAPYDGRTGLGVRLPAAHYKVTSPVRYDIAGRHLDGNHSRITVEGDCPALYVTNDKSKSPGALSNFYVESGNPTLLVVNDWTMKVRS